MTQEKKALLRHCLNFFFITVAAHLISLLFYIVMLASAMEHALRSGTGQHKVIIVIFSLALLLIFVIYLAIDFARDGERRRGYLALTKERDFTLPEKFKYLYRDILLCTVIYLFVQLPYTVFYAMLGVDYDHMVTFERFYVFDLAMYETTDSAVLGFLLNALIFFAAMLSLRLYVLWNWSRERI